MGTELAVSLGLKLLGVVVQTFTKAQLPQTLIDAAQAAYDAVEAHKNDLMTKQQWEDERGL